MNNKEKTILACKELIKKYENAQLGQKFHYAHECPFCKMYQKDTCKGCAMASKWGKMGCIGFDSFQEMKDCTNDHCILNRTDYKEAFQARADFFKKIIPILKKIPAKRFTKSGWTYFSELKRTW